MTAAAITEDREDGFPPPAVASAVLSVLAIATVVAYLDRQILALVVGPIKAAFGVSDTQVGLLYGAAFSICFAVAGLPLGRLVDRVSRRNILIAGIVVWSLMTIACGLAETFTQLFLYRMGVGVGEACLVPASYSLVSDLFRRDRRGRAAGVIGSATTMGAGASLLVGGAILGAVGDAPTMSLPIVGEIESWRGIFIIVGLPGMLIALLMLSFREPVRQGAGGRAADPFSGRYLPYLRENIAIIGPVLVANVAIILAASGVASWAPTTLIRRFGLAPSEVGLMVGTAMLIGGFAGPTLGGLMSDRWIKAGRAGGRMRLYYFGVPICVAGHLLFALGPTPLLALTGQVLGVGAAAGLTTAALTALQDICPNQYRGQTIALSSFLTNVIGLSAGPAAVAAISDHVLGRPELLALAIIGVSIPSALVALAAARRTISARPALA